MPKSQFLCADLSLKAYLTSLNLSAPVLALVWTAGPIAGMTLQPYFGICSDQCRSSWGRRRPFIAGGAIAAVCCLLSLASVKLLAHTLFRLFADDCTYWDHDYRSPVPNDGCYHGREKEATAVETTIAVCLAVSLIVALNVAIQPLQGGLRALLADSCPREQQATANAVAGAVISAINILSYGMGFLDLTNIAPLRDLGGDSQFGILCVGTSIVLAVSVAITCLTAVERQPVEVGGEDCLQEDTHSTVWSRLRYLITSFPRLPQQVQQVYKVQFLSWMGWFPFLYYISTYIGNACK